MIVNLVVIKYTTMKFLLHRRVFVFSHLPSYICSLWMVDPNCLQHKQRKEKNSLFVIPIGNFWSPGNCKKRSRLVIRL